MDSRVEYFGLMVRRLRREMGYTQVELARAVGVRQAYISELECGKVDPKLSTALRFCSVFGTTINDLLGLPFLTEHLT